MGYNVKTKELHPQLITLASVDLLLSCNLRLMHMWQTMHNCHQIQNHISQQLNHLTGQQNLEPTTESHQQAAAQLQTQVTVNMVSEAIKCLLSAVHSIVIQQQEECNMRKRSERLGRKLERELALLSEVEMKFAGSFSLEDANSVLTSNHPLTIRRAKVEALRILVDDEKVKYISMKRTRYMILNNLQTSLPKVFQALMVFSSAYAHSFEEMLSNVTVSECEDVQTPIYEI